MFLLFDLGLQTLAVYVLAAIVPAISLLAYIYRHDKIEQEPISLLSKLFWCGVFCAIPAIILELIADYFIVPELDIQTQMEYGIISALFVGLIEEGCKFFFLYKKTWKNVNFNYTFDGIVYAVTVSLGFAAIENIIYVFSYGLEIALTRALTAIPGHMSFAVFMGYFYSIAKKQSVQGRNKTFYLLASYLIAVALHTAYDAILMVESESTSLIYIAFIIVLYFVVYKKVQKASRRDTYIG